jgi:hypothetical protein
MPAANLFDAAAPVRGVLLRRHLEKLRITFVELPLVELPGDHEFHRRVLSVLGFVVMLQKKVESPNETKMSDGGRNRAPARSGSMEIISKVDRTAVRRSLM